MLKLTHDLSTGLGRLARLADDLELLELNENRTFCLGHWRSACGTSACAVGYCMQADWANKLGFEADWTSEPMYGRERNWHAVCRFFEIDIYEAKELFYPPDDLCEERYHNPVAQAAHMKEFLKQKGYYS